MTIICQVIKLFGLLGTGLWSVISIIAMITGVIVLVMLIFLYYRIVSVYKKTKAASYNRLDRQFIDGIFKHSGLGHALVNTDGSLIKVNKEFCKILGRTRDELLSKSFKWQDITPEPDLAIDIANLEDVVSGKKSGYSIQKRYIRPDFTLVRCRLTVWKVTGIDGGIEHFAVQIIDITDNYKEHYEVIFNSSVVPTIMFNSDSMTAESINDEAALLFNNYIDRHLKTIIDDDIIAFINSIDDNFKKEIRVNIDGDIKYIKLFISKVSGSSFMIIQLLDITASELLEIELKTNIDRLERSNNSLSQFAHIAAHDIKEPLRMISGFMLALKEDYYTQIPKEAQEFLDYALDGANKLKLMTDELLNFSELGCTTEKDIYSIKMLVEDAKSLLKQEIKESGTDIVINTDGSIFFNRELFIIVLKNIIGNSIKYRRDGISPIIEIDSVNKGMFTHIKIKDNGIGIDDSNREVIFGLFQRIGSNRSGRGIGLSTCRKIIRGNGGDILAYKNTDSDGMTVVIKVPREHGND